MKKQNGITLIALIITIIILLILAGVSISILTGENGVFTRAQNAVNRNSRLSDKEIIALATQEYVISKASEEKINNAKITADFVDFIETEDWCESAVYDDEIKITTIKMKDSQKEYEVNKEGTVDDKIEIGAYVNYNLPYTDVRTEYQFTSIDGWRYLGRDNEGNKLIVTTGLPGKLWYQYDQNIGKEANGWWGTDEQVKELFGEKYIANGYNSDNGGYPNRYAAAGLLRNFENIPYTIGTNNPTVANTMTGLVQGNGEEGPLGATLGTAFRANELTNKILNVRSMHINELNRALGREDRNTCAPVGSDTTGLIYLKTLNNYGYTSETDSWWYWIGYPGDHSMYVRYVGYHTNIYNGGHANPDIYFRPVVTFASDVAFEQNLDGSVTIR